MAKTQNNHTGPLDILRLLMDYTGKDNQHADTPITNSDDKDSEVKIQPPRKSSLMLHLNLFHRENASMTNLAQTTQSSSTLEVMEIVDIVA